MRAKQMEQKATKQQMTLEEYKKKVEECFLKRYPNTTREYYLKSIERISQGLWEQYMKDFSPEMLPKAWEAGA